MIPYALQQRVSSPTVGTIRQPHHSLQIQLNSRAIWMARDVYLVGLSRQESIGVEVASSIFEELSGISAADSELT